MTTLLRLAAMLLGAALLAPRPATANDVEDDLERHTVRIVCSVTTPQGTRSNTGSGFLVGDSRHVVTNHHVASSSSCANGRRLVVYGGRADGKPQLRTWTLLATNAEKDIAILRTDEPIDGKEPVARVLLARDVGSRYGVFAVGFPGASDSHNDGTSFTRPTTTQGIVSRKVTREGGTRAYQIDAAISPGSSGGPLFDACGQLLGINAAGDVKRVVVGYNPDRTPIYDRIPLSAGYAIQADELVPMLDKARLAYAVGSSCTPMTMHLNQLVTAALVLFGSLGILRFTALGQGLAARVPWVAGMFAPRARREAAARGPRLLGVSGPLRDVEIALDGTPLAIGRDARVSVLAVPPGHDAVSKRHCVITADPRTGHAELEDCWSTNGTFLASGERVPPGARVALAPGVRFYLGTVDVMFEFRSPG